MPINLSGSNGVNSSGNIVTDGEISAVGNITTDNYFLGNGSQLTGITTANVDLTAVTTDIIPAANVTNDLGNATNQWRDLWLSNATIYMDSIPINLSQVTLANGQPANTLAIGTNPVVAEYTDANLGNITSSGNVTAANVSATSFNWSNGTPIISNTGNLDINTISAAGNIIGNALIANSANISGDIYFNSGYAADQVSAAGNVTAGNVITTGTVISTGDVLTDGNVSAVGNVTGNYFIGNGSQLTGLPAQYSNVNVAAYLANANTTGDIYGGNISAYGNVSADANATIGGFLNVQAITGGTMQIYATGTLQNISLSATGNIDVGATYINRVADPVQDQDAATKYYVDASAQGLNVKTPVVAATAAALDAYTYDNGTAGVGATITADAVGNLIVDGILLATNNRVLVKNETAGNAPYNGIYEVTTAGDPSTAFVLTRSADNDTQAEIIGSLVFADQGNTNGSTSWFDTNTPTVTVGTTDITWVQFSSAGVGAGNGLSQSGRILNVNTDGVTTTINGSNQVAIKASANLVTPNIGNAVGNSLVLSGNVTTSEAINSNLVVVSSNVVAGNILTDGYYYANGTPLGLSSSGISNGSSNIEIPTANSAVIFTVGGNFAGAVGTNVAILGDASGTNGFYVNPVRNDLSNIANVVYYNAVTKELTYAPTAPTYGNVNVAAYLANSTTNGDIYAGSIRANGVVSATGSITTSNNLSVAANATVGGTVSAAGNITGNANLTVAVNATVAGNITGGNLSVGVGNIIAGNIEAGYYTTIPGTNANITIDPDGTGVFVITARTPTYFANTESSINPTTGAVTFAGGVGISGNLNVGGNFSANNTNFTNITVSNSGNIGNLTVPGTATITGNATTGNVNSSGSLSATGNVHGGNINTAGQVSATGNTTAGNVITSGVVQASGNVSGGNLFTSGSAFATGNIAGGNLNTAGTANVGTLAVQGNATVALNATVAGNATAGNLLTGGIVSATGNATAGNILTAGFVSATGNVIGGNLVTAGNANITGNINVNYIFAAGNVVATGNVDAPIVNTANIYGNTMDITATGTNQDINLNTNGTGNIVLNSTYINGVLDPVQAQDAATKGYVDSVATGLQVKASSNVATTTGLPAYTYNNGTFGVGATITGSANGVLIIDTVTLTGGERVLVKDETSTNAPYNGIYDVTVAGDAGNAYVLTRSSDDDTPADMYAAYTFISSGADNGTTSWTCTAVATSPINIGFDAINWVQFSSASEYSNGNGLALNGTVFSVNVDNNTTAIQGANVIVKAGANLTTPNIGNATGNSLSLVGSGNISGGNLAMTGAATVAGNLTAGNISTGIITATGTATAGNLLTSGVMSATGNVTAGNLSTAGTLFVGEDSTQSGNISALSQIFVGPTANTTTLTGPVIFAQGAANGFSQIGLININGNSSADMITYASNGDDTSGFADLGMTGNTFNDLNYTITKANDGYLFVQGTTDGGGNLVLATGDVGNTHDIVFATGGFADTNEKLRLVDASTTLLPYANLSLNLGSSTNYFGNVYANSLALAEDFTANNISAVNNISGVNLSATGTANIGETNITGNLTVSGNTTTSGMTSVIGNVTTSANVNARSGAVSGNIVNANVLNVSGVATFGQVGDLRIYGGANGQALITTGNGNLVWGDAGSGGGSNIAAIPTVYFSAIANANNQSFSNVILNGYSNAESMMVFYNGALLENSLYALSGDTLIVNTPLVVGDTIDIPTQYGGNINTVNSGYGNSNVAAFFTNYAGNIVPAVDNAYTLGNVTRRWSTVYSANVVATTVSATGSVIGANIVGGAITGTTVSTTGNITGANIRTTGSVTASGNVDASGMYIDGSVTITGNAAIQGNLTYNNLTNLTTANLVLGLGNTTTGANVSGGGLVIGNTNEAQFLYDFSSQSWVSNIAITSNTAVNAGNVVAVTNVTAGANVIAGNVNVSSSVSVAGNITTGGNLLGNVTGTQVNATTISASGNISGANVVAVTLSASGNVVANNVGNITPVNLNGSTSQFLAGDGTWKSPGASTLRDITKISAVSIGDTLLIADDRLFCIKGNGDGAGTNYHTGLGTNGSDILSGVNNCYEIVFPNEVPGTLVDADIYGYSAYALFSNGNLYTWGYNGVGNLGLGNTTDVFLPTLSNTSVAEVYTHPSSISSDPVYTRLVIRKTDNTFYGCGYNGEGQLGLGNTTSTISTWTQLTWIPTTVLSVWNIGSYGGAMIIQKADGSIWVTGYNGTGQLGLGNTTSPISTATAAPAWLGGDNTMRIQSIYAGQRYYDAGGSVTVYSITMFLDNGSGSLLLASGSNNWGNFGTGNTTNQTSPVAPLATTGLSGRIAEVRGVGSAVATMFVRMANGDLFTYGYNSQGTCGNGGVGSNVTTPYRVFVGTCAAIVGNQQGWYYNSYYTPSPLIQKTDDTYWAWGYGPFGQVGNGTNTSITSSPTQVRFNKGTEIKFLSTVTTNNEGVAQIAVTTDNTIIAYGYNYFWLIDPAASNQNLLVPTTFTPNNLRK